MAAVSVEVLPEGPEWTYELKFDGYRALIIKDGASVQIRSRNDKDLMPIYPVVAAAARRVGFSRKRASNVALMLEPAGFGPGDHGRRKAYRLSCFQNVHDVFPARIGRKPSDVWTTLMATNRPTL
jgi:hypothetical protein